MRLLVGDLVHRAARSRPRRPAVSLASEGVLTFAQVQEAGARMAQALRGQGLGHGDRVAWIGDTTLAVVPLFVAAADLGAVFLPVNARYRLEEAAGVLARAQPRLVVTGPTHSEFGAALADEGHAVAHVGGPGPGPDLDALAAAARPEREPEPALAETDPHIVFFTSGSTGQPKGVVISHRANTLRSLPGTWPPGPGATVCMFPLFHMAGWTMALQAWAMGEEVVFVDAAQPDPLLTAVEQRRARRMYLIPAVWHRVLAAVPGGRDLSCLRDADTGTSATPPELLEAIRGALPHTRTRVAYGSTEAGIGTMLHHEDLDRKPGSVGLASPGVEVRLAGDGEVLLRSPFLMDGYLGDPGATATSLRDGWYHTGDQGALDDEGYLSIVGRVREVIRTGGETVAPVEVEKVLADHPAVAEVAVVGMPDERWGEVVTAVVVPVDGRPVPDVEELQRHAGDRLAPFKLPRRVAAAPSLPRTAATGQVQRTLLVERLQTEGGSG